MKKTFLLFFALLFTTVMFAQNQLPSATNATAGKLTVSFATTSPGTESYFAVYVTNSAGALVNTLYYRYASTYKSQLKTLYGLILNASPTSTNLKFVGTPDGVSGATITAAVTTKTVYWGQSAAMATAVAALADGNYKVNFEMVKRNDNWTYGSAIFAKGPATSTPVVPATLGFTGMTVSWVPASTAINDVEMEKMYSVYPSPAVNSIFVSGLDIESVDICSLSAKILMQSKEQKINISQLPKGAYLAVVYTKNGLVVKKFQKM